MKPEQFKTRMQEIKAYAQQNTKLIGVLIDLNSQQLMMDKR